MYHLRFACDVLCASNGAMAVSHATIRFLLSREWYRSRLLRTEVNSGPDGGMGDSRESSLTSAPVYGSTLRRAVPCERAAAYAGSPERRHRTVRARSPLRLSEERAH